MQLWQQVTNGNWRSSIGNAVAAGIIAARNMQMKRMCAINIRASKEEEIEFIPIRHEPFPVPKSIQLFSGRDKLLNCLLQQPPLYVLRTHEFNRRTSYYFCHCIVKQFSLKLH